MKAILRNIRISSKKMNLVAGLVRRKTVADALPILKFTPKKAAAILYKVVQSAADNAVKNFNQDKSTLYIKEIIVNEGVTMKRFKPASKGRAHPILKRSAIITVYVESKGAPAHKASAKAKGKMEELATPVTEEKSAPKKVVRKKAPAKPKKAEPVA